MDPQGETGQNTSGPSQHLTIGPVSPEFVLHQFGRTLARALKFGLRPASAGDPLQGCRHIALCEAKGRPPFNSQ